MSEQYSLAWKMELLSRRKDLLVALFENVCRERDKKDSHIATLEALLKEAGEALDGIDSEYYVGDYRRAAEVGKKIRDALGGEG